MWMPKKWVEAIAQNVVDRKWEEWPKEPPKEPPSPEAMDAETEDALLICYAWDKKLLSATDVVRRIGIWREMYPAIDYGLFLSFMYEGRAEQAITKTSPLRQRIDAIYREADAEIKAQAHRAAQKALKEATK